MLSYSSSSIRADDCAGFNVTKSENTPTFKVPPEDDGADAPPALELAPLLDEAGAEV